MRGDVQLLLVSTTRCFEVVVGFFSIACHNNSLDVGCNVEDVAFFSDVINSRLSKVTPPRQACPSQVVVRSARMLTTSLLGTQIRVCALIGGLLCGRVADRLSVSSG